MTAPVLPEPNFTEPNFTEPWQARAFAMVLALHEKGLFTWPEWAATLAGQIRQDPKADYYQQWLAALEQITHAKGLVDHRKGLVDHRK